MGPWLAKAPALVYAWYGGLEGGNALARVLFGDVDASGRLPCTFPKRLLDSPAHALNAAETPSHEPNAIYPGTAGRNSTVTYAEGLLVGYRWFDAKQIEPLFPFGYGLSYTKFSWSGLQLVQGGDPANPSITVQFTVANADLRPAGEPEPYPSAQGTERLRQGPSKAGAIAESVHPARSKRFRLLRSGQKRMGCRKGQFQNPGRQFLAGYSLEWRLSALANRL
jgi:hypothetical protein